MAYDGQINYPDPLKRRSEVMKEAQMIKPLIKAKPFIWKKREVKGSQLRNTIGKLIV